MIPKVIMVSRLTDGLTELVTDLVENPDPQRRYPMSGLLEPHQANYKAAGIGKLSAVGVFPEDVSPVGAMDLAGNITEWTRSNYQAYPYQINANREDLNSRSAKVIRGGAYSDDAEKWPRCSYRIGYLPNLGLYDLGFRLVVMSLSSFANRRDI